jgi:hypothetical protein
MCFLFRFNSADNGSILAADMVKLEWTRPLCEIIVLGKGQLCMSDSDEK